MKIFGRYIVLPVMFYIRRGRDNYGVWTSERPALSVRFIPSHSSGTYDVKAWHLQIETAKREWGFEFVWRLDITRERWNAVKYRVFKRKQFLAKYPQYHEVNGKIELRPERTQTGSAG